MDVASIIAANTTYVILAILPPVVWLLFYLREDSHPEPKSLILLAFLGGIVSAFFAIVAEVFLIGEGIGILSPWLSLGQNVFIFFLVIALVEEYAKYLPIKFAILGRPEFDEPVDGMIYMMTAAMGFAAIENILFIFPVFHNSWFLGLEVTANRFLGANLLHALASGIVGFFLARAYFSPKRHHFIALGVVIAAVLHAGFNYLIMVREDLSHGTFYLILLLATMAVMVFVEFERLKKVKA